MKRLALLLLLVPFPLFAQDSAAKPAAQKGENVEDYPALKEFSNLPADARKQFAQHLEEASKLFTQKRIFECMDELSKCSAIFEKSPALLNIKGACYVEFRDFEKARACFVRALELQPGVATVLFNLGEVEFCDHNWQKAHDLFSNVLERTKEGEVAMRRLVEFKIMLCKIKLGKLDEAKAMATKYDFLDDSPYHYYANAVIAFQANDSLKAEEWLAIANRIFRDPAVLSPWQDTLIEFGYIKSFYGGEIGEER
jgi:Flp pilus assembly protein TadD